MDRHSLQYIHVQLGTIQAQLLLIQLLPYAQQTTSPTKLQTALNPKVMCASLYAINMGRRVALILPQLGRLRAVLVAILMLGLAIGIIVLLMLIFLLLMMGLMGLLIVILFLGRAALKYQLRILSSVMVCALCLAPHQVMGSVSRKVTVERIQRL